MPKFQPGQRANPAGRRVAVERRAAILAPLEAALTEHGGPLNAFERAELDLAVSLIDRSNRCPMTNRVTAERAAATARRILKELRAGRERLKPEPKTGVDALREYLASKEHAGSAQ